MVNTTDIMKRCISNSCLTCRNVAQGIILHKHLAKSKVDTALHPRQRLSGAYGGCCTHIKWHQLLASRQNSSITQWMCEWHRKFTTTIYLNRRNSARSSSPMRSSSMLPIIAGTVFFCPVTHWLSAAIIMCATNNAPEGWCRSPLAHSRHEQCLIQASVHPCPCRIDSYSVVHHTFGKIAE